MIYSFNQRKVGISAAPGCTPIPDVYAGPSCVMLAASGLLRNACYGKLGIETERFVGCTLPLDAFLGHFCVWFGVT